MNFKLIVLAAAVAVSPLAASAATQTFFSKDAFLAALGLNAFQTEDFSGFASGTLLDGTTFAKTGVTVSPLKPNDGTRTQGSGTALENSVTDEKLRLSIDNSGSPSNAAGDTGNTEVVFTLAGATTFLGLDFGLTDPTPRQGIGNDSGTSAMSIGINGFSYDFSTDYSADPGYVGFFGVITDEAFSSFKFASNGSGGFTDDDFAVDNLISAAAPGNEIPPVPLPAGLPLLLGGLAAFGIARSRRTA